MRTAYRKPRDKERPDRRPTQGGRLGALTQPNTTKTGYVAPLDGIRAIAIAAVMGSHAGNAPGGIFGVDIFLVLSGYLITGLLYGEHQRTGTISIRRFYIRRILRLLPAVVVSVLGLAVLASLILPAGQTGYVWWDALSIFGYYANVWQPMHGMVIFGHFWSLSLEEQYYFVWPLLMLLLVRRVNARVLVYALGGLSVAAWLTGIIWWRLGGGAQGTASNWISTMLPTRGFGLFIGSGLALMVKAGMVPTSRRFGRYLTVAATGSVVLWIALFRALPFASAALQRDATFFGYPLFGLTTALVVLHACSERPSLLNRVLAHRYMVLLGVWSYSLYLVHLPIFVFFAQSGWSGVVRKPVMIAVSILAAGILHEVVERPFLSWRDRLRQPRQTLSVDPPVGHADYRASPSLSEAEA